MYLLYPILAMLFWLAGPSGTGGESILGRYAELGMSIALVGAILLVAYFLDHRRIYLRL
jgi:hypothetical protein